MSIKKNRKGSESNTSLRQAHSFKMLECSKGCGRSEKVDAHIESVICWYCTAMRIAPPEIRSSVPKTTQTSKKPKGWHFMKEFVDADGNVFHEGVEKPELKGTLPATPIKPKKTKAQKDAEKEKKEARLVKLYEKKKAKLKKQRSETNAAISETEQSTA